MMIMCVVCVSVLELSWLCRFSVVLVVRLVRLCLGGVMCSVGWLLGVRCMFLLGVSVFMLCGCVKCVCGSSRCW